MAYPELFGAPTRQGVALTPDGKRLPWQAFGRRGEDWPTLVCCNGLGCSTFFWHHLARYFSQVTEVITWDYRGHGDSDPPADYSETTLEQTARDLRTVMADAEVVKSALVGHSLGVQVILEAYRQDAQGIAGLVPMLGTYGRAMETFFNTRLTAVVFPAVYRVVTALPGPVEAAARFSARAPFTLPLASLTGMVNGTLIRKRDLAAYLDNLACLDMRVFMGLARAMGRHDAMDVLPTVQVPTLVVGGERDIFTPLQQSRQMHERIAGSELLIIPGGSHAALVEQPELINLRLEKFLRERVRHHAKRPESTTARVLDALSDARLEDDGVPRSSA